MPLSGQKSSDHRHAPGARATERDAMIRLHELGSRYIRDSNLDGVFAEMVDAAIAITGADFGNIQLLDAVSGSLNIVAQRNFPDWWLDYWQNVDKGQGSCGSALEHGERVIVEDVACSPLFVATPALEIQLRAGVRAVQSTPLVGRAGDFLGVFSTHYKSPCRPDERTLRLLDLLAQQVADIIERARAEHALRISRERLELALVASGLGAWDMDLSSGNVIHDERLCAMLGYRPGEIAANAAGWFELMHPDDKERAIATMRAHERGETPNYRNEYRCRHRDGHWVWLLSVGKIVARDAQGEPLRIVGTVRDITAEKRMSEEGADLLRRIETMMRDVLAGPAANAAAGGTDGAAGRSVLERLPARQRQILVMIARGMTSAAIAGKLQIATATVVSHRRELMRRLNLHHTAELTRFALQHGLLTP